MRSYARSLVPKFPSVERNVLSNCTTSDNPALIPWPISGGKEWAKRETFEQLIPNNHRSNSEVVSSTHSPESPSKTTPQLPFSGEACKPGLY